MKKKPTKKKNRLIGITGGIGAGKSVVARIIAEAGYPVFSADEIARELTAPGAPALAAIQNVFGPGAVAGDGSFDRAFVRGEIVKDPARRVKLEAILHPLIQARSLELAQEQFADGKALVFYEAPLLYEANSDRRMDAVICVHAPDEIRITRVLKRDGGSREHAEKLLASQLPQAEKMERADYLVENAGSERELAGKVTELLKQLS